MTTKKRNYDFNVKKENRTFIVKTVFCKFPKMTEIYKELKRKYENREIDFFYYDTSLPF